MRHTSLRVLSAFRCSRSQRFLTCCLFLYKKVSGLLLLPVSRLSLEQLSGEHGR
jgi:hypothetical protein